MLAQYCTFLWCFSVVFRDMGISNPKILVSMGIVLIAVTVAVFGFALWRASVEHQQLRSEQQVEERTGALGGEKSDEEKDHAGSITAPSGDQQEELSAEPKRGGGGSPTQLTAVEVSVDEQHGTTRNMWQVLGLCAAESESATDEDVAHGSNGDSDTDVAALQAKLAAQSKLLREKDDALMEKDAEIARLAAAVVY